MEPRGAAATALLDLSEQTIDGPAVRPEELLNRRPQSAASERSASGRALGGGGRISPRRPLRPEPPDAPRRTKPSPRKSSLRVIARGHAVDAAGVARAAPAPSPRAAHLRSSARPQNNPRAFR